MSIAETIKRIRKDNKLTQDAMAEKLFVTRAAVSKWERGRGLPNIDSIMLISKTFDVPLAELLDGIPKKSEPATDATPERVKKKRKYFSVYFFLSIAFVILGISLGFYADILPCAVIALISLGLALVMIIAHCFATDDFSFCFWGVLLLILISLFHHLIYPII